MTTQEMIFDYLKVQGLVPEYDEDKDIRFKYQMRNFVVSNYPDDRQFLQIMMPFIFDVTAENRVAALEACNKRLSQIVHVHPAHADAFDAAGLLRKRFDAVAEGIVSNVDARTVLKPGIGFVFGINSRHSFAAV